MMARSVPAMGTALQISTDNHLRPCQCEAHMWLGRANESIVGYGWSESPAADLREAVQSCLRGIQLDDKDPYKTGRAARRFKDVQWTTLDSWSRKRRVIGKKRRAKPLTASLASHRRMDPALSTR
jgi:hypothetical protein